MPIATVIHRSFTLAMDCRETLADSAGKPYPTRGKPEPLTEFGRRRDGSAAREVLDKRPIRRESGM
jgi:hypothetical protein